MIKFESAQDNLNIYSKSQTNQMSCKYIIHIERKY